MAKIIASPIFPLSLTDMIDYFKASGTLFYTSGSISSYISYVNKINVISNYQVEGWINNVIMNDPKPDDPVQAVMNCLQPLLTSPSRPAPKVISGFKKFVQAITGYFYANTWLTMGDDDELFCELIAKNALFASPEIVDKVKNGIFGTKKSKDAKKKYSNYDNPYASWDYMEHFRDNQLKKNKIKKVPDPTFPRKYPGTMPYKVVDDNTTANQYIKIAILKTFEQYHPNVTFPSTYWKNLRDYEACHVWDLPKEREYYASIPNLVLLPRGLAQLTDHNDAVKNLLRYEVFKRFQFVPNGITPPKKPKNYINYKWRNL